MILLGLGVLLENSLLRRKTFLLPSGKCHRGKVPPDNSTPVERMRYIPDTLNMGHTKTLYREMQGHTNTLHKEIGNIKAQ